MKTVVVGDECLERLGDNNAQNAQRLFDNNIAQNTQKY